MIRFIRFHKWGFYEASTCKNIFASAKTFFPHDSFLFRFISSRFDSITKLVLYLFEKRKNYWFQITRATMLPTFENFVSFIIILFREYVQRILIKSSCIIIEQQCKNTIFSFIKVEVMKKINKNTSWSILRYISIRFHNWLFFNNMHIEFCNCETLALTNTFKKAKYIICIRV